jgi:hypothetical protein
MDIKEINKLRLEMGLPLYFGKITDKEMLELIEINKTTNEIKFWKNTNPPRIEECIEMLDLSLNDYDIMYHRLENIEHNQNELHLDLIEDLALTNMRIKAFSQRLKELKFEDKQEDEEVYETTWMDRLLDVIYFWDKTPTRTQQKQAKQLQKKIVGRQKINIHK